MTVSSILIASDLSDRSDRAVRRGLQLARKLGAKVHLVSVLDDAIPADMMPSLDRRARNQLEAAVAEDGADVRCEIDVRCGDPMRELLSLASGERHELLVVGRHRRREVFDGLRRTTVETAVYHSLKPVLIVVDAVSTDYERILIPGRFLSHLPSGCKPSSERGPRCR